MSRGGIAGATDVAEKEEDKDEGEEEEEEETVLKSVGGDFMFVGVRVGLLGKAANSTDGSTESLAAVKSLEGRRSVGNVGGAVEEKVLEDAEEVEDAKEFKNPKDGKDEDAPFVSYTPLGGVTIILNGGASDSSLGVFCLLC